MTTSSNVGRALVPVVGAAAVVFAPIEMDGHTRSAMAISVAMVLCWVTEVLHSAIVAFVGCFLFRATGDVEFDKAFGGFGTTTPWFLYGALLLFGAAERSGLIQWLGAHTPRPILRSTLTAGLALIAVSYLLALVVPSSLARGTLVSILAVAFARFRGSPGTGGLVLIATYSAAMFGHADMTGGPRSVIGWDVATALALLASVLWLSTRSTAGAGGTITPDGAPITLDLRMATPVMIAAGFWATTPLHGIPPALVGLGAGLACCLPGFAPGAGSGSDNPDPLAIILAGAAISIPVVLMETRAVDAFTHLWLFSNQWAGGLPDDLVAYWTTTAYRLFSPDGAQPGLPAITGPAGDQESTAVWAYAGNTMLALHQSPALIFGLSVGGFRAWQVLAVGLAVLAAGSVVVMM